MYEVQSKVVMEMAKNLIDLARVLDPAWEKAYYRYYTDGIQSGSNGSYIVGAEASLIGALKYGNFYQTMSGLSSKLFEILGKKRGVLLLRSDSSFDYKIDFEFENLERWHITKLDGASGIPNGI